MIETTHFGCRGSLQEIILIALPAGFVFYLLLWLSALYVPIADDYHAVLAFTNGFAQQSGIPAHFEYILNYQHNEYKLIFESGLIALEYLLVGHLSFESLVWLGNAFVFPLFIVLALAYRVPSRHPSLRLLLLAPLSLLLFQLQYASTLNWAMGALQNLPVLVFALGSLLLLSRDLPGRFPTACCFMLLSISSSGNGFLAAIVGCGLLVEQKRWRQTFLWLLVLGVAGFAYFHHYDFTISQARPTQSITGLLTHLNSPYAFSYLGSSLAGSVSYRPGLCFGIVLCGLTGLACWKGYFRQNPAVFYSIIFLVVTGFTVSVMRSRLGIEQSLASRYRIYSNLLVIMIYIFLTETYWHLIRTKRRALLVGVSMLVLCGSFCAASDRAGFRFLIGRREAVLDAMQQWQHPQLKPTALDQDNNAALTRQIRSGLYEPQVSILAESIALGVYRPKATH